MRTPAFPTRTFLLAALIAALLALPACGDDDDADTTATNGVTTSETEKTESTAPESGANAPAPSGDAVRAEKVEIVDFAYDPDPVTIEEGGKVTWVNRDLAPHTATADDGSFNTEGLVKDKLASETFKEPGTYPYYCELHPEMRGTVEVVPSE